MILNCAFEEMTAIQAGAERVLALSEPGAGVVAPPQATVDVEALLHRLGSEIELHFLVEQESVERALHYILADLHDRMDTLVLEQYVGSEDSIRAYFEYASVLSVLDRAERIGAEMRGMIELMHGTITEEAARTVNFD